MYGIIWKTQQHCLYENNLFYTSLLLTLQIRATGNPLP